MKIGELMKSRIHFVIGVTIALLVVAAGGCGKEKPAAAGTGKAKYHCPMHPTYISDRPGDCPICNMKLVPIKEETQASGPAAQPAEYHCPMCPEVTSKEPGLCPECNMKLVPRPSHGEHAGHVAPPGRVAVSISAEKRNLIGLKTTEVTMMALTNHVRTAAVVQHDETRYARIAPRFGGWVKKLYVNYTGAPVEQGQPLFTVYSPDLFSTENEYLVAFRAFQQATNTSPGTVQTAEAMLRAARMRLELFQVAEEEIRALKASGAPRPELLVRAPFSGHVLERKAVEGQAFNAGEALFEIADLSRVWLLAAVYESDLPHINVGQPAVVSFPFLNKHFETKVTFVSPHIDPQTRRGEVRLELENVGHELRPDMWADVEFRFEFGERLAMPASSVIDTGRRFVAFVDGPEHHLEPREVKLGVRTDDYYEVISGVEAGEHVVTRALFLIDSESQLKSAIAGMSPGTAHEH